MLKSNFEKLVEILPLVKLQNDQFLTHDFDYMSAGVSKKIILDEMINPIVEELYQVVKEFWGHENFNINCLPTYFIRSRYKDKLDIIECLLLKFYYFDGEKQRVMFDIGIDITVDGVKIDNQNDQKRDYKFVYEKMQNKLKEIVSREYKE